MAASSTLAQITREIDWGVTLGFRRRIISITCRHWSQGVFLVVRGNIALLAVVRWG
uniref:Uncharacterized protein n=1 Tax=Arundo donax TaxID=35708 RepID=A0A0A9FBV0_ARUDO